MKSSLPKFHGENSGGPTRERSVKTIEPVKKNELIFFKSV